MDSADAVKGSLKIFRNTIPSSHTSLCETIGYPETKDVADWDAHKTKSNLLGNRKTTQNGENEL